MHTCNGPSLETPRARAQAGLWGLLRVLSREEITGEDCLRISDAQHRNTEAEEEGEVAAGTPGRGLWGQVGCSSTILYNFRRSLDFQRL